MIHFRQFSSYLLLILSAHIASAKTSDSVQASVPLRDSAQAVSGLNRGTTAPGGEYPFTPDQDSRFYEARTLHLAPSLRFELDARRVFQELLSPPDAKTVLSEIIRQNMVIQPLLSSETMTELVQYKEDISRAMSIPGVKQFSELPGLFAPGNLGGIKRLLGMEEDISPTMRYTLDERALVNVSIFSQQADRVRLMLHGFQSAGAYSMVWNGRNDADLRVTVGDYVGVVAIGTKTALRKRIRID